MHHGPLKRCGTPWEPRLQQLVAFMFTNAMIQDGAVVTAGAHLGEEACHFAELDRNRTVHAFEPLLANHACIERFASTRPNIALMLGGLSSHEGQVSLGSVGPKGGAHLTPGGTMLESIDGLVSKKAGSDSASFPVYKLDNLFLKHQGTFRGERLAFLHLDIEGSERSALTGARRLIQRDRPVIVSETNITDASYLPQLALLHEFGYRVLMVHELCGSLIGCRNLVSLPQERWGQAARLRDWRVDGVRPTVTDAPPAIRYNTVDAKIDAAGFAAFREWNQYKLTCGTYQGSQPWRHGG
jgi:FkbM family methyltransferase